LANIAVAATSAQKTTLIVGSELDFPPFALVREDGKADGFTVDLWRAVARDAHLDATIKTGPFHEILEQFKHGQIDVLINLAQSAERRRFAEFAVPHVKMGGAIFVRQGGKQIKSENDLSTHSLIVIRADLAHDYAVARGWRNLTLVDTVAEGMKLLADSRTHDAMLVGRLVGLNTIKQLKLANLQALDLKPNFSQHFSFVVRKGDADHLAQINDALANLRANGTYDAIYNKWFGGLEPQPLTAETIVKYLGPAVLMILLLAVAYLRERALRRRWMEAAAAHERSENALRVSEARFAAFMNRSPAIAFIKDENGRYLYVNKTWEDTYALDWRGKTDAEIWPRDEAKTFSDSDRRALETGQASESFETVLDKDGLPQDWWVMKFPVLDGDGKKLLGGVALDISERKRAEAMLRRREQQLVEAQRIGKMGSWELNLQTNHLEWSDEIFRLFEIDPTHFNASFESFLNLVHPADRDAVHLAYTASVRDRTPYEIVHRLLMADGRIKWMRERAETFYDEEGCPLRSVGSVQDITASKNAADALRAARDGLELRVEERTAELSQANALLRQKEEQLSLAQRAGHIGLWSRDLTKGESSMSAQWNELMGFPLSRAQVSFGEFLARIHPDDRALIRARTLASNDGDFETEFRINHPQKGERWLYSRGRRGIFSEDSHRYMMGALIDVTARKRAEEKLTEAKDLLQKVIDSSPDWIFAKDLDHRFLFVNRAFAEAQGVAPDDMIGKLDSEFWSEELCEGNGAKGIRGFHEDDRAAFRGEVVHNSADPASLGDGSVHIFDTFKHPMRDEDGRIFGVLCYCRDTTERQQAEEAVRASEERLRAILDHSPAPVFIKDTAGRYLHVNCRFEELFGVEAKNCLGRTDAELFGPEQARAFMAHDREVLAGGTAIQFEGAAQYRDGEHTSLVNKFPLRDGEGKVYALCGIATDITARKRAEDRLRQLTEQLDRRVAERTRELAESQTRLRSLVAEITKTEERERRRLAVELHDYLAQTLTVSRLNIGRAAKLATNEVVKLRLTEAQRSVDDSIAYTRSLIAQLSPRVLYDLGLPAALTWLAAQHKDRHGLDVEIRGAADGKTLDEDRSVLAYQCIRELLWNIVKHAGTNQAWVSYRIEDDQLSVEVTDEGRGFDPEELRGNGNGDNLEKFGLFSIRERLERLGGRFEVISSSGQGTRARFSLPSRTIDTANLIKGYTPLDAPNALAAEKRLSVALVDDHEVVRQGLRRVLEEYADLTVVGEAKDGLEGVELARSFHPDVVVMDVNMPGMNGIEATKLITREMPSTIVVGLSFETGAQIAQAMKAAGAFTCVSKQRAIEDIHQAIIDAVAGRRTAKNIDNGELIIDSGR
jgi:PAS domain S-box-containing protein